MYLNLFVFIIYILYVMYSYNESHTHTCRCMCIMRIILCIFGYIRIVYSHSISFQLQWHCFVSRYMYFIFIYFRN